MNIYYIPEYGQRSLTIACIASIRKQDREGSIVVGNDGDHKIKPPLPNIKLIDWPDNVGYVKNLNRTVKETAPHDDDILFMLNNDIKFLGKSIKVLSNYASNNAAIVGPIIKIPKMKKTHRQMILPGERIPKEPEILTVISGCCLVMKASIWFDVGGLDEDYNIYYSDDQFCIDAAVKGYPSIFLPSAQIEHYVGITIGRNRNTMKIVTNDKRTFESKNPGRIWSPDGVY